jgi:hypothetical protein
MGYSSATEFPRDFRVNMREAHIAPGQKLRWKRKPMLTSWKLMNSKLSSR